MAERGRTTRVCLLLLAGMQWTTRGFFLFALGCIAAFCAWFSLRFFRQLADYLARKWFEAPW